MTNADQPAFPKPEVHALVIGHSTYYVDGANTDELKLLARHLGVRYDSLTPARLNPRNGFIKIWGIGELADHLNNFTGKQTFTPT